MHKWSVDKIIAIGLIAALLISILTFVWTGKGTELQNTIAGGLVGYLSRTLQEFAGDKKEDSPCK